MKIIRLLVYKIHIIPDGFEAHFKVGESYVKIFLINFGKTERQSDQGENQFTDLQKRNALPEISSGNASQFFWHFSSNTCLSGAGDVQVVEPPDAIKTVLVRWNSVKIDLNELARLRWIKKMSLPQICKTLQWSRSTVQVSIRTIRNCGVSKMNLEEFEKISIQEAINDEIEVLLRQQKNFRLNSVSSEFGK
jgi:hypothetical protein